MSIIDHIENAPVNTDVSAFRDTGYLVWFNTLGGITCPRCKSGEVWQPPQTMDMPMHVRCLRCGKHGRTKEFAVSK